jgi:hypothetical protein
MAAENNASAAKQVIGDLALSSPLALSGKCNNE